MRVTEMVTSSQLMISAALLEQSYTSLSAREMSSESAACNPIMPQP